MHNRSLAWFCYTYHTLKIWGNLFLLLFFFLIPCFRIPAGAAGYVSLHTLDTTPLDFGVLTAKEKADCESSPQLLRWVTYEYLIHPEDKIRTRNHKDSESQKKITFIPMLARAKASRVPGDLPKCPCVRIIWKKHPAGGNGGRWGEWSGETAHLLQSLKDREAPMGRVRIKTSTSRVSLERV